jgi:hypothetical protein
MRLIDVDKEIQGLRRTINIHQNGDDDELLANRIFEKFIEWLMQVPTVEAEPIRHGHWIPHKVMIRSFNAKNFDCSECKIENYPTAYCPNCGAKMDSKEKEE